MKHFIISILALLLTQTIAILAQQTQVAASKPKAVELNVDEEGDNPNARAEYERMRLHDPATGKIPDHIRQKELRFAATVPTKESLGGLKSYKGKRVSMVQSLAWSQRGPSNVGGRTRALAIDITDANIILAGGVSGGMWRSSDGGNSWAKVTDDSALQSVTCIAQDTRAGHTNIWYYGTGETTYNSASAHISSIYAGDGMFKSTDNGISWTQILSTVSGTPQSWDQFDFIYSIAIDSSNAIQDIVYAATWGGIKRSTDGGATWSVVLGAETLGPGNSFYTDIAITSTGVLYATLSQASLSTILGTDSSSSSRGVYRSVDGTNWTNILPVGWPNKYNRIVMGIAPSEENVLYFLGEMPGSGLHTVYAGRDNWTSFWKYTYLSGDGSGGGGTWGNRSSNLPSGGTGGDFANQQSYDLVVRVKPDDENVVFIGGVNLFRSTDGFATTSNTKWIGGWSTSGHFAYPNHWADQHAIIFSPSDPSIMFSGNDAGVFKTTAPLAVSVEWTSLNNGYFTCQFYSVAIDHATTGNDVVIGGAQDNGTRFTGSANSTTPWIKIDVGDGGHSAVADGRTSYYTSQQNGVIYRRLLDVNGSQTGWTRVDPSGGTGYLFIAPFILDPNNTDMMYLAGGTSIWRNSDLTAIPLSSDNPTSVNWTHLTNTTISGTKISALGISTTTANRLYYGTSNDFFGTSNDGHVFRLDGANAGNPIPTDVTGLNFPVDANVSCIAVDPGDADRVITVFSNYSVVSLFYTTDGGSSWTDVSGNLEQHPDGSGDGPSCRWASIIPGNGVFVGTSTGVYSTAALNGDSTVWAQEGCSNIGNVVVDMLDVRLSDGYIVAATHGNGMYSATLGAVTQNFAVQNRWNMVSVPLTVCDYRKTTLFPTAISPAFAYQRMYVSKDTLVNSTGYWMKFSGAQTIAMAGSPLTTDTIEVDTGWNLIGSISQPIMASSITSNPPGMITGRFFAYASNYVTSDSIKPGNAYWVNVNQNGSLILSSNASASLNTINIIPTNERPPPAPTDANIEHLISIIPASFSLGQNYPNPFNPTTSYSFQVSDFGFVSLKVFDVLGREVVTIVSEQLQPGEYTRTWDANGAASGVYFYRLVSGKFSETRKMILLK